MKRIPQLDGLRGIAILMVFVYHGLHVPLLWSGVDLFFVLSGFLITGILLNLKEERAAKGYWRPFYLRRLRRIVPPYLGFMLFLALFFQVPWSRIWYWYAFGGANIAYALGERFVHAMDPLWSLAVEEQFYFVWPWIVLLCSRKTLKWVAVGIMAGAPLLRAIATPLFSTRYPIYALTPFRADSLACGAFIAICCAQDAGWVQRNRRWALYSLIAAGTLLCAFSVRHSFRLNADTLFFNIVGFSLIVVIFGSALIQTLGMQEGWGYTILTFRPLRYFGLISYTAYLYHMAILDMIGERVHSQAAVFFLSFAIIGVFSAISWHFFESPILSLKRMRTQEIRLDLRVPSVTSEDSGSIPGRPSPAIRKAPLASERSVR